MYKHQTIILTTPFNYCQDLQDSLSFQTEHVESRESFGCNTLESKLATFVCRVKTVPREHRVLLAIIEISELHLAQDLNKQSNDSLRRRKENQDAFCVCDVLAGDADATLLSVFDGHGPQGAFVSHFVREQYHQAVAKTYAALVSPSCWRADGHDRHDAMRDIERKGESIECDIITEVFRQASQIVTEILNASEIDISVSGTTAVSILVRKTDLFIANIGDSRAVVAKFSDEQQCYRLHCETKDHKPDVPEECTRIKMHNGRVFDWGSCRVWLQDVDMPGLAMSRSFGDSVAKTVGVIAEPDVFIVETVEFGSTDRDQEEQRPLAFAVLASDGIWEFMTTEECIHFLGECIINTGMSPQDACTALIEEACKRWDSEEDVIDDITAVVVYF
ncbi:protein phosphatase [Plasmopara halstedii]|uniref:Protein phosphatase n=1 Tax=Plasmopara halstedii TaxID=4781 RepID=A0A0P1APJ6_PLAHL|nr:protein phosphatase [Plasmopara halstedii]CEG43255.1 protein phosphatase [Plasmopara halstedii]|eukprot:XP_024579624.1 protein phosphatase [Plasmopara halstedii]